MSESKTGHVHEMFNSVSDKIYIGSTFNAVRKRFDRHKSKCEQWKKNGECNPNTTSAILFDEDFDNVKWGIVEEVKVMNRKELTKMEGKHIRIDKKKCVDRCAVEGMQRTKM